MKDTRLILPVLHRSCKLLDNGGFRGIAESEEAGQPEAIRQADDPAHRLGFERPDPARPDAFVPGGEDHILDSGPEVEVEPGAPDAKVDDGYDVGGRLLAGKAVAGRCDVAGPAQTGKYLTPRR